MVWKSVNVQMGAIKTLFGIWRLSPAPLGQRISSSKRYYHLYIFHKERQMTQQLQNLKFLQQREKQSQYKEKLKQQLRQYAGKAEKKLESKRQEYATKNQTEYEKEVKGLLNKGMSYLSLYYESLQSLIEGRREVLNNDEFQFEDGMTVKKKQKDFKNKFSKLLGKTEKSSVK